MSAMMIRLDGDLKRRVAAAARRARNSPHAFIVDAITRAVERAEADAAFHGVADARWARIIETGKTVPLADASRWLEARLRGQHPQRPLARKPQP